jgi:hypothetical protein
MRPRRLSSIPAALLAVAVLAACGGGGASSNGVASKSPQEILTAVQSAIQTVKSVHVSGSVVTNGQPISLDLHLVSGKGGQGNMSISGLSIQVVVTNGTIYINGSRDFWRHFAGAAGATLFQGKWLKAPETGNFGSFAQLTNLSSLFGKIASTHGVLKRGATTTVNGQPAVAINDTTQGGTLYVATTGQAYPLVISKTGAGGGRITFDQYNRSVSLSPPKNAIDLSQFQGGA